MATPAAAKSKLVQDKRFQHVHSDPRFQRAPKSERKFKPDARFSKMFTDKSFRTNFKVDAWGRKVETEGAQHELRKYYDMDDATIKAAQVAAAEEEAEQKPKKSSKGAAAAAAKPVKGKAVAAKGKAGKGGRAAAAAGSEVDEEGFDGNYISDRRMAPPSSGDDDESEGEEAGDADGDEEESSDAEARLISTLEAEEEAAGSSADEASDIEMEADVAEETEEVETGETTSRRLAVMNLEWDRLSAQDLLVLFRSFVSVEPTPAASGKVKHPVRCVKVYPSEFGRKRMEEEATFGPVGIYAGKASAAEYKKQLEEKLAKVQLPDAEEEEDGSEQQKEELEDESERSDEEESEEDGAGKKKRVSFHAEAATSKKRKSTPVVPTPAKVRPSKAAAAADMTEEEREATDDILSRPAPGADAASDSDSDDDDAAAPSLTSAGEERAFDPEKLRRYELERLKYYYAIVECESAAVAEQLYAACDGLEFEHSSNMLDLRYVPDDVTFTPEEDALIRDQCSKVPANYKAPDFYTQALQHTSVQLTWDRDDPTRTKLLTRKFGKGDEEADDLAAYLGSSGEEDGYGSDALTEASDSASEQESDDAEEEAEEDETVEGDEDAEGGVRRKKAGSKAKAPAKAKTKVVLKRKARAKYLALLQEIKADAAQASTDAADADSREVSVTFEPGLKARGEELAKKHLTKADAPEGESTWEKHLRERLEKKREKKKRRKEKLKGGADAADSDDSDAPAKGASAAKRSRGGDDEDSGDEAIGANTKSDLYEDDDVEIDESDPFFTRSDDDEADFPQPKAKKGGKASKAAVASSEDEVSMSSESDEGHVGRDDSEDDDAASDDDQEPLSAKAKARNFFDDSISARKTAQAKAKGDKDAKDKKRKRGGDDADADDAETAARKAAELELLMIDEQRGAGAEGAGDDDAGEGGKRGYSLQALMASKKAADLAAAGGKLHKSKRAKLAAQSASAAGDSFKLDTRDERFAPLFSHAAFSIDPTNPAFKRTEGSDALLAEKARRRAAQEKAHAEEVQRRKKEAAAGKSGAAAASATNASSASGAPASSVDSSGASVSSMVASLKRKAAEAAAKQTAVLPVGKGPAAPASKRSKPDSGASMRTAHGKQ